MARPKSDDRRSAIMAAAVRVIASQGLSAATATIAKEAGISNGSLFTYFETKADLLNQLYIELKQEMAAAALDGIPAADDLREQSLHMWMHWLRWAMDCPEKRRTLAHLDIAGEITPESRQAAKQTMAGVARLLARVHERGAMRDLPLEFAIELMNALADTTIDSVVRDPRNADRYCLAGFEALWRMIA